MLSGHWSEEILVCQKGDKAWVAANTVDGIQKQLQLYPKPPPTERADPCWIVLKRTHTHTPYLQAGPYTAAEIYELFHKGDIKRTDYLWRRGLPEWCPLTMCSDFEIPPPPPQSYPKVRSPLQAEPAPSFVIPPLNEVKENAIVESPLEATGGNLATTFGQPTITPSTNDPNIDLAVCTADATTPPNAEKNMFATGPLDAASETTLTAAPSDNESSLEPPASAEPSVSMTPTAAPRELSASTEPHIIHETAPPPQSPPIESWEETQALQETKEEEASEKNTTQALTTTTSESFVVSKSKISAMLPWIFHRDLDFIPSPRQVWGGARKVWAYTSPILAFFGTYLLSALLFLRKHIVLGLQQIPPLSLALAHALHRWWQGVSYTQRLKILVFLAAMIASGLAIWIWKNAQMPVPPAYPTQISQDWRDKGLEMHLHAPYQSGAIAWLTLHSQKERILSWNRFHKQLRLTLDANGKAVARLDAFHLPNGYYNAILTVGHIVKKTVVFIGANPEQFSQKLAQYQEKIRSQRLKEQMRVQQHDLNI